MPYSIYCNKGCEKDTRDGKFLRNMVAQGDTTSKLNTVVVGRKFSIHKMYLNLLPIHPKVCCKNSLHNKIVS